MDTHGVEIPDFTLEDFTDTDAPYRFLVENSENKFQMQQLAAKMKTKAAAVGMRSFMRVLGDYLKMAAKESANVIDAQSDFEGLPDGVGQLATGKYSCTVNGISVKDGYGEERVICPHQIAPIRRFVNLDSGEELLELWFRRGTGQKATRDRTIIFAKDDIANNILRLAKYGVVVTQKNAKDLAQYLLDMEEYNYGTLEEKRSVTRLGWVGDDEFSPYVEDVHFDGEEDFGGMFSAVRSEGDLNTWIDTIKKVRVEKTAARIYLAASFASVILKPCGLLPFLVHTWGGSENGKTVALMMAASVWACPELGEYVTTYNGTRYAQETTAAFLNNLPLCLDELQIQASQGVKDFDDIIYQLCEGVSKKQGKASGGLRKQQRWRNVILSTGEHTIIKPMSGGGARNRVIEIEAPEKIYHDLVGLCEIINHNYGYAGREFVNWLRQDGNMDKVRQIQKDYYQKLLATDATEKQVGSASAILTADQIATELFFKDGQCLTVEDISAVLLKKDDLDVNQKTLEWLFDFISANRTHFNQDANTEFWGRIDEDARVVYIISSIFNRELKANGLDSRSFLSWAARHDFIEHEAGRNTKTTRLLGTNSRQKCVCVKIPTEDEIPETVGMSGFLDDVILPF